MLALQTLGEALIHLSPPQLNEFDIPSGLREAIKDARKMKKHGAIARQRQYIGKLMRDLDPEPIRQQLDRVLAPGKVEIKKMHNTERWHGAMIEGSDVVVQEFIMDYPSVDRSYLRRLVREAQKELNSPEHREAARALFQYLKSCIY